MMNWTTKLARMARTKHALLTTLAVVALAVSCLGLLAMAVSGGLSHRPTGELRLRDDERGGGLPWLTDVQHLRLGERYKAEGHGQLAKKHLKAALSGDEGLHHARFMLGEIYQQEGRRGKALACFRSVYAANVSDPGPGLKAAEVCREKGNDAGALAFYAKVLVNTPDIPLALYWSGVLNEGSGRYGEAARHYDRLLSLEPSHEDARDRLNRLRLLGEPPALFVSVCPHLWRILLPVAFAICLLGVVVYINSRGGGRAARLCDWESVVMFALGLTLLLFAHYVRVMKDPALNGEELAVAFRNPAFLIRGLQPDGFTTTFSSMVLFWGGSRIMPGTIHDGRIFKILAMATVPVLVSIFLRGARRNGAFWCRLLAVMLFCSSPVVSWLSIMSTENGLECVFVLLCLLVALGLQWRGSAFGVCARALVVAAVVAWTVHIYGSAVTVVPVVAGVIIVNLCSQLRALPARQRVVPVLAFCVCVAATSVAVLWPYAVFSTRPLEILGGVRTRAWRVEGCFLGIRALLGDLFVIPQSYLVRGEVFQAAFPLYRTGVLVLVLAGWGAWDGVRKLNTGSMALLMICLLNLALTLVGQENPGVRRILPLALSTCMLAGMGAENVGRWIRTSRFGIVRRLGIPVLIAVVLSLCMTTFLQNYQDVNAKYRCWLQREFTYRQGLTYEETVEALVNEMRDSTLVLSSAEYSWDTVLLLTHLCERRGYHYHKPQYDGQWDPRLPRKAFLVPGPEGNTETRQGQ